MLKGKCTKYIAIYCSSTFSIGNNCAKGYCNTIILRTKSVVYRNTIIVIENNYISPIAKNDELLIAISAINDVTA